MTSFETTTATSAERHVLTSIVSYPDAYLTYVPDNNPAPYNTGNHEHSAASRDMIQHGQVPLLDNGWAFAMDRRPAGREGEPIPATVFTRRYFRHGLIPFAAADHSLHDHDLDHMPIYQWMFSVPRFAILARTAAINASPTETLCKEFTGAMDNLGDCLGSIQSDRASNGSVFIGDLRGARNDLGRLITLDARSANPESTREESLVDELWNALGLAIYENKAIDLIPGLRYYSDDKRNIAQPDMLAVQSRQKRNALTSKVSLALQGLTRLLL